jgi:hypothetical protein
MDYIHGLAPCCTIQQLVQQIQIDRHEGSADTFEVLILYMPLHRRALLFMLSPNVGSLPLNWGILD